MLLSDRHAWEYASAEFTIGEGELMAHDVPLGCAPDEHDDLISGTCSHLPYPKSPLFALRSPVFERKSPVFGYELTCIPTSAALCWFLMLRQPRQPLLGKVKQLITMPSRPTLAVPRFFSDTEDAWARRIC